MGASHIETGKMRLPHELMSVVKKTPVGTKRVRRIQIGDVGKKGIVWKQNHGSTNTTGIRKVTWLKRRAKEGVSFTEHLESTE